MPDDPRQLIPVLVPVRYSHNHGTDIFFRVSFVRNPRSTPDIILAGSKAEESVREEMVAEYGEEDVEHDERDYGGFEAHAWLDDGDQVLGTDGHYYRVRLERADAPLPMSKEELAARNKNGTECAACGGPLKGPYPGMLHCPECEG